MKKIIIRTTSGIVYVGLTIGSILWNKWAFAGLFLVLVFIALLEFFRLAKIKQVKPNLISGMFAGIITYLSATLFAFGIIGYEALLFILTAGILVFIVELFRKNAEPFTSIAYAFLGSMYISLPVACLNFLFSPWEMTGAYHPNILIAFFVVIWTSDTAAFLIGTAFGKHRLFERISPKKTWEGSIGGLVFGIIAIWVLSLFFKDLTIMEWIIFAAIVMIMSTFGDLIESMLKRSVQVKDSGTIMPGHGGMLDRLDGIFIAAPAALIFFLILKLI